MTYTCPRPQVYYACELEYVYDEDALACALTALRDRTPGIISGGGQNPDGFCGLEGCGAVSVTIAIAADGTAARQSCTGHPLEGESGSAGMGQLREPAFFQQCLDMPVVSDRYACLNDTLQASTAACGP